MNKNARVIVSGFGGQGVMMVGQVLAYAGVEAGLNSLWYPSYGPETRGGTAHCAVSLSTQTIGSPVFSTATAALVFNRPSLEKFAGKIDSNGVLFFNASLITDAESIPSKGKRFGVPIYEMAAKLQDSRVANMILMGVYLEQSQILDDTMIRLGIEHVLGPSKLHLVELNMQAVQAGRDYFKNLL